MIFLYAAGLADAEETALAEALLSSGSPAAAGAYAEAVAVYHALPLGLSPVDPPAAVRDAVFGRVTADAGVPAMRLAEGAAAGPDAQPVTAAPTDYASRLRWPVYAASGLAACFAVALSLSVWNNYRMSDRSARIAATEDLMRSPQLTLASLKTETPSQSHGRVLFCTTTRKFQVTAFGLAPLPPGKGYELWLITRDQRKVPAGMLAMDEQGTGTYTAESPEPLENTAVVAVTDEPAGGSLAPTGLIHLAGALP